MSGLAIAVPTATVWTGPDAPRDIDAPAVADQPDLAEWTQHMDVAARQGLHGRTLTQALLGERVDVVAERGDWVEVRLPWQPSSTDAHGYPGWLRRAHLDPAAEEAATTAVVTTPTAAASTKNGTIWLSYGTCLPVLYEAEGSMTVALPGRRTATVRCADTRPWASERISDSGLLAPARQFLGLRYLWGGTSAWGLDCSGFVHLIHRAHGVRVRRDAYDQHDEARSVPLDDAGPGDLYFFARRGERVYHVGFVTNDAGVAPRRMLHAPEAAKQIEDAPLASRRLEFLVAAGRLLPHPPSQSSETYRPDSGGQ